MGTMTVETFLNEARRLRAAAAEAETEFMEFLYAGEQTPGLWQGSGLSFVEFVERNDLCKATRYIRWKRVRDAQGVDVTTSVGIHAAVAAGSFSDPHVQREVLEEARKWEATNETSISEQSAARLARDVKIRFAAIRGHKRHKSYADLLDDYERLCVENKKLREENVLLRAELKKRKRVPGKAEARPS